MMRYLIAYDISAPRRYRAIVRALAGYGYRSQYSVYECDMTPAQFARLWQQLAEIVNPEEDRLLAYRLCHKDSPGIIHLGQACESPDWQYRII